jgi:YVTN family beta-propeller protein
LWSAGDPWIGSWLRAATAQQVASPTRSSPIAITSDDQFVWSVNPDNNSVSVFSAALNPVQKVAEVPVGIEPWCVAITPNNAKVYVTNMVSGTVSVINATTRAVIKTIPVGTEPFGCALSPDGKKLYVANQSSDDVSLINTATDVVTKTIRPVGPKPHGIAVSADGTKVYVTQFLSQSKADDDLRPLTQTEGADDGRVGRVTVLDGVGDRPIRVVTLKSFDVAAFFQSDGNTLAREPLTAVFNNPTKAFPNLLESILIRGNIAYVTGTCSSPNGPFRFNVNVQSCVSTIDTTQDVEIKTVNMNDGVNFEVPGETRLFNTNPFALAFKRSAAEGFVAVAATNRLLRVSLDGQGLPTINAPTAPLTPGAASPIIRIQLRDPNDPTDVDDAQDLFGGKNPRGLVINSADTRLRDGFPLARRGRRRHRGRRSDPVQDLAAGCLGEPAGGGHDGRDRSAGQVPLQRRHRAGRHGRQLATRCGPDVGHRLGLVLWMPPQRGPGRQRDVDVRRRPAPDHLDGKHVPVRAGGHPERRAQAARVASAGAQLVGHPRRSAGLRAQHPGRVRWRRAHSGGVCRGRRRPGQYPRFPVRRRPIATV